MKEPIFYQREEKGRKRRTKSLERKEKKIGELIKNARDREQTVCTAATTQN